MNSAVAFMLVGLSAVLSCLSVRSFGITVVLVTVPQSSFANLKSLIEIAKIAKNFDEPNK